MRLTTPYEEWDSVVPVADDRRMNLSRLKPGEQFVYVFDFGDGWTHLCTVEPERVDPLDVLGTIPAVPLSHWGWGDIPDQYGRRWQGDDGESPPPANPGVSDLPPLRPWWGERE